jgi:hypothetical protein
METTLGKNEYNLQNDHLRSSGVGFGEEFSPVARHVEQS